MIGCLRHDPIRPLLATRHPAIAAFVRRDLLDERQSGLELAETAEARRVLSRQRSDGGWSYPAPKLDIRSEADYDQLETFRQLGVLVNMFELDRRHPATQRAARFLGRFQTAEGDYRGIYGRQYTPNYSAAITERLIRAGYAGAPQVERTMRWLLTIRQDDGGWAIPTRTRNMPLREMLTARETCQPDRSRPSAHLVTGIVLRAFAAHPRYRSSPDAFRAGELLKSRFFKRDTYADHAAASYWTVFSYPYWWTDLLSALDSLHALGFTADDADVGRGIDWFIEHQDRNGLWNPGRNRPKSADADSWVGLAICRVLRRYSVELGSSTTTAVSVDRRVE